MKIRELDMHCGECDIIDFCGNGCGYCICNQVRFKDTDTDKYKKHAETAVTQEYGACCGCEKEDCKSCEVSDEARDYYCEQVAEHVAAMI